MIPEVEATLLRHLNAPPGPIVHLSHRTIPGLLNSSRVWLLSVCSKTCGFCQALAPEWSAVAHRLRQEVRVAYWDGDLHGRPPVALGEFNATPTIRAFVPWPLAERPPEQFEYDGNRSTADLTRFARALVPDLVQVIVDDDGWARLEARAVADRLPRLLIFCVRRAGASTPPILRAVSAAYAGRAYVGEVRIHSTAWTAAKATAAGAPFAMPSRLPAACLIAHPDASMSCNSAIPTFDRITALADEGIVLAREAGWHPGAATVIANSLGSGGGPPSSRETRGSDDVASRKEEL